MEFKVGDTIGKDEERLLRAHLKEDQSNMDETLDEEYEDIIREHMSEINASLNKSGVRTEYVAVVLSLMTDKLEVQRMYCAAKGIPMFAPPVCHTCGRSWTTALSGESHITGCPHCHRSWSE